MRLRCLGCGYPVMPEISLRCSECGRMHTIAELNQWFAGGEAARFDRVVGFTQLALAMKALLLPSTFGLVGFSTPVQVVYIFSWVACVWAALTAGWGRFATRAGNIAAAALHVAGFALIISLYKLATGSVVLPFGDWDAAYGMLELAAAVLVLNAMLHASAGVTVPEARRSVHVAWGLLLFVLIAVLIESVGPVREALSGVRAIGGAVYPTKLLLIAIILAGWAGVWWRLTVVRKRLFGSATPRRSGAPPRASAARAGVAAPQATTLREPAMRGPAARPAPAGRTASEAQAATPALRTGRATTTSRRD
ncbi:MAG: hypothetical protein AB7Q17_12555 [Phycisphaerae bacterium]